MKKHLLISLFALLFSQNVYAETRINKDLDGDSKPDRVWLQDDVLHIKLSSQNKVITKHNVCDEPPQLKNARVGFIVLCSAMRHGRSFHYAHNATNGKMQYIGYDFWAFGTAANEGAGQDSLNLKTGDYVAKWRLRDKPTDKLRDHHIKTRLPNIQPLDINHPELSQEWLMIFEAIKQEKLRRKLPIH
ncbi:hypothetical protein [Wielerella bovis]|uniref:hypothetical protein n=1 Tax=Wielerella bovis TaxID=2917790 RepID=UPI0020199EA3|nr:hypothetical protein [Wielerella bovis]ULJ63978.1 hypothetical protein MIS33_07345 [Wielerella bovis]ULJ68041.1 hypothetical protein MIS31_05790 [Wielerella bovis]